ncbi:MAG: patatin-like phospholipase family protein [Bdellovibrionales bacterium]|nr:patatin-like phospholipase family protein [Bdellovibrionales bacterium]
MTVRNDFCVVLSGGGARGAYQAGALRALYELCRETRNFAPFRNLVGVSAGAINAAYLAAEADNLDRATEKMCGMWRTLTTDDVFATDSLTVSMTAFRMLRAISLGGFSDKLRPTQSALLNVEPLRDLLAENIHFGQIPEHIRAGRLNSLCITALDYSTAVGVTFFMGSPHLQEWRRVHRVGLRQDIGIDHVMGSAAIPLFFPPWKIGDRYFGDGVLRNTAPLSPARRIGASKLLVIGVRKSKDEKMTADNIIKPTLGRVLSVVINAIFMDAIEVDIERVRIINENLKMASPTETFRQMEILHVQPSQAPSDLAEARIEGLPPMLRFLISSLGSPRESAEILSYLTFDPIYLNALVDLGYYDLMKQKENLIQFLRD